MAVKRTSPERHAPVVNLHNNHYDDQTAIRCTHWGNKEENQDCSQHEQHQIESFKVGESAARLPG
jgi:hypothetical protein